MPEPLLLDGRLPSLVINYPSCSHCGEDVDLEDGIPSCPRCLIQWSSIDEDADAEPNPNIDGTDVPCLIERAETHREHEYKGNHVVEDYQPCILPSGHETAEHLWRVAYLATPIPKGSPADANN